MQRQLKRDVEGTFELSCIVIHAEGHVEPIILLIAAQIAQLCWHGDNEQTVAV
jgi:hypothetical protein